MSIAAQVRAYGWRVWRFRYFWMSLVKIDLHNRYRGSVLGIGWTLLHPLAMTVVLCTVFHQLMNLDLRQYAPYVLSGIAIWNYLSTTILEGCHCIYQGEKYIRSSPLPMAIYPLRTTLTVGVHFFIILALTLLVTLFTRGYSNPLALLALVPSTLLVFAFGWSMAVLFGFANVYFPDTHHLTQIALQVLFYITPVFYPPELIKLPVLRSVVQLNPLATMVRLIRDPILENAVPSFATYGTGVLTVAVVAGLALLTLATQERKAIFYM